MERDRTEILLACNYFPEAETLAASGRNQVNSLSTRLLGFQMGVRRFGPGRYGRLAERSAGGLGIRLLLHGLGTEDRTRSGSGLHGKSGQECTRRILELSGNPGSSLHLCGGIPDAPETAAGDHCGSLSAC